MEARAGSREDESFEESSLSTVVLVLLYTMDSLVYAVGSLFLAMSLLVMSRKMVGMM